MMVVAHNYTDMNSLNDLTSVGYTEAHFLYIADILYSHGLNPRFQIFDNQGRYNPASWMIPFRHEFIQTLEGIQHGVFCLSNPSGKRNMCRELHLEAKQFITLIHAKAFVSPLAIIGSGVRIDAGVVINGLAKLGDFINIYWPSCANRRFQYHPTICRDRGWLQARIMRNHWHRREVDK
jgi:hypothetical protein